ncbi:MAG: hypothetical protein ACLP07_06660 [Terracidiphilus sp.]
METLIESPRVAFVSGSSLPASSPFSLYRLILPILCISLGVSVGTATGLTLALVNASRNSVAASSDSVQSSAAPSANLEANSSPAQATQPAVAASPIATPTTLTANPPANPTVELRPAKLSHAPTSVSRPAAAPSKVEVAFNKTPDALKPATFKLEGKTYRVAKMMFLPAARPEQHEPVAAQPAPPTALNTAQWSLDSPAPASLYTEGVLTVSDYSASTGTIQTSDGRTFALGTTVAAANATSWETYRSDVHYRCDQNGSCVLMRAGVVAPDAKLI